MNDIISIYITLMPIILAGILNMVWCKLPIAKPLQVPMDRGGVYKDGKRIFGDNKTWKGFFGYLFLGAVMYLLWGALSTGSVFLSEHNFFYYTHANTASYNLLIGILLGLGYALFELPNSFLKRRLDIEPGKTVSGWQKFFFVFLDQADSIIGCAIVVWLFYDIGILRFLGFVLLGAVTHILINMLLYSVGLRKNML